MKFQIRHEIRGRMRIHVIQSRMSFAQADTLQYYLEQCESVISAKIQNRTEDVTICSDVCSSDLPILKIPEEK